MCPTTGYVRKVELSHENLTHQVDAVAKAWDLNERASFLNALPLNDSYGATTALAAPLGVGGKVVMLSNFDPTHVWALLLGIGVNDDAKPWPKVNFLPSLPGHYQQLLQRYAESFPGSKEQDYVRYKCRRRLRATVSSNGPVPRELRAAWLRATGFAISDCYTTLAAGTVMTEPVGDGPQPRRALEGGDDAGYDAPSLEAMPSVSTRIVR